MKLQTVFALPFFKDTIAVAVDWESDNDSLRRLEDSWEDASIVITAICRAMSS